MATNDLTSQVRALAWLGLPVDDSAGTVARLISAVSTQVQQFLSRTIALTSYTSTFNGKGNDRLMTPNYPIVSVSSVTIWTQTVPARVLGSSPGFTFDENTVYVDQPYRFERGVQNVKISYSAGYETVPADLEQAVLDLIKINYDGQERAANVLMNKVGDTEERFALDVTDINRAVIPIPPAIYGKLQPYVRVYPA